MSDETAGASAKVDPRDRLRYTKANEREAVWFLGDRVEFVLTGDMTDGRLMIYYHESHPNSQPPLHEHEVEDEIHYIIEGGITYWAGAEEITLYAGDSMVLPRDLPHTFRSLPDVSTKWFTITSPTNFEDFVREMSEPCTVDGPQPGWEMTPALAGRLNDSAARHGITVLGPPGTFPRDVPGGAEPVVRGSRGAEPAEARVVRQFWAARSAGDREATRTLLSEDVTWQVVGRNHACARTFHGPDGFLGELGGLLGPAFVPGSRSIEITNLLVSGDHVVTELHETMTARNGDDVVLDIVTVMRLESGRIVECREYMDLTEVRAAIP